MTRIALALALTVALAACNREAPPAEPAATVDPAPAAEPAPSAAPAFTSDAPKPEGTFSPADIAGTYMGDGTLVLNADGTYVQTGGAHAEDGTWAAEGTDGMHLRLDPNSKSAQDRVMHITPDALTPMAGDNAAAPGSTPFKRQAMP